ncbi:MAG: MiaB/RimO family radical SAM methylthiotransferase [Planctomycetes bacterium]|nr:MiaB/RimO family radical SAM methylthiotransferase [Planctomycetota bacterium]
MNHAETREIESVLLARGLARTDGPEPADLEVVHTCSVTTTAAAKSRHAVRRARRRQGETPFVLVTGCYAETNRDEAIGIAGDPARVIAHEDVAANGATMIDRLTDAVDRWLAGPSAETDPRRPEPPPAAASGGRLAGLPVIMPERDAGSHVRAELRIQDGCDAHCTFCIIPKIRRTLRSKTVGDAVAEARRLVDLGHREIVLTGIFIGAYGHETALRRHQADPNAEPLADLIDAVAAVPGLERLRVSSMEPGDVTAALLDAMVANAPTVVPHLHLPLQSGSDRVLGRMNRQYRVDAYLEMIVAVNAALTTGDGLPPAITTDIICGFPGETDADFERTLEVARRVGYLHMHVFPYSARPGTAASRWRDDFVDESVKKQRVRRLIDLEDDPVDGLSLRYRRKLRERALRVILEQPDRSDPAFMTGRCDHYALVHVRTDRPRGTVITTTIQDVTADRTTAVQEPASVPLPVLTA